MLQYSCYFYHLQVPFPDDVRQYLMVSRDYFLDEDLKNGIHDEVS